ncbi:MAG TPA: recombination mediator RecR [Candidatus Omnitrophota bacterium]|nr:recombination mediator RecR [Candidatus Omnitrophota bacterium]
MAYPRIIENLIEKLTKLPGVGRRSAERIVFWLLENPREDVLGLSEDIVKLKDNLTFCRICNNLSETEVCMICSDANRRDDMICVVESPKDVLAIEKTGQYHGSYHVLLGVVSPAEGKGPEGLRLNQLINRVKNQNVTEVILATDADTEGETTALFIVDRLKEFKVKVSRIGVGIPMGSAVEYADLSTLGMSLNSRREIQP